MIQLDNLTTDAVEICIISLCEGSENSDIPSEKHWRVGLLNSSSGRERLHEVLTNYPESQQEVLVAWGDSPTVIED